MNASRAYHQSQRTWPHHQHGYAIDRLVLSRDATFTPDGDGPAETLAGR